MKLSRAQKKAKMEAAAGELIEAMLNWDEENEAPNLVAIEDEVLLLRQRFGQVLAETLVAGQESQQPVESPNCGQCGARMRFKGKRRKVVESRVGEVKLVRGYYVCPRCGSGLFPPGQPT